MRKISSRQLPFLLMLVYMVSYLTRINYGAVILEMEGATGFSKAQLSTALTFSAITYGAGQLLSGYLGDRMQPKRLILSGLIITTLMNLLIPLFPYPGAMAAIWAVNGLAQAFMWPPITRLMLSLLSDDEYKKATVTVSIGSSVGTILIYLLSPVMISMTGWRSVFLFSAACALLMLFVLMRCDITLPAASRIKEKAAGSSAAWLSPMLLFIMLAIVLQGALRDGVSTWMPSYISETYNLGSGIAILTGVVLPLFGIACHKTAEYIYRRKLNNPVLLGGLIFALGAFSAFLLIFLTGKNATASVICTAILTGSMHGVNLMLICMVPAFYKNTGRVSLISGVVNSCTYVGSAISTYGIALLTEGYGWNTTVLIWFLIALSGTAICFLCIPAWKRRFGKQ